MGSPKPSFHSIVQRIWGVCQAYPESPALIDEQGETTFRAFTEKAAQFAGYLMKLGVAPGSSVALCMERSSDWIVTALGVLMSGAAYVPLDPTWPDTRILAVLRDSGAAVLVAPKLLTERLGSSALGVDFRGSAAAIASAPRVRDVAIQPEGLAYVIYTSGSTGAPKGVEITHANLAHLIDWHVDCFGVTKEDRASHLAGLGFDAAVWEIWPNLAAGAGLCIPDDHVRASADQIQEWMLKEGITIGFVPTLHAAELMGRPWPPHAKLRVLLTGGDALQAGPTQKLPFSVVNNYGPTECTVVATSASVPMGLSGPPTIGSAIPGARIYVLDDSRAPVPDGEVGELYVGGSGVGRGYRNLTELTDERFLPDPFVETPGRMYRTGDRGVRRPDGQIEFRGRVDRQVKIRGNRIELDEIGALLRGYPGVVFALADTKQGAGGELSLIAYVLLKDGVEPTLHELQEHLGRRLPTYMLPGEFLRLRRLPISANGKIDLQGLSKAVLGPLASESPVCTVASSLEERLLVLMRELLNNDTVTPEDNFFFVGGHSLLGMQLLMRLQRDFEVSLSLRQLFDASSVKNLAYLTEQALTQKRITGIWKDLLRVSSVEPQDDFYSLGGDKELLRTLRHRVRLEFDREMPTEGVGVRLTLREQTEFLCDRERPQSAFPAGILPLRPGGKKPALFWAYYPCEHLAAEMEDGQPFLHVSFSPQDLDALGDAPEFPEIASCFMVKILAAQSEGPYTLGGFCVGGLLAYEIALQMQRAGHEVANLLLVDTPSPTYYRSPRALEARANQPLYIMRRMTQLSLRTSFKKVGERVVRRLPERLKRSPKKIPSQDREFFRIQDMVEAAASRYDPGGYDGEMVLLLASTRPPHVNFVPGWQSKIRGKLHVEYVPGQHLELIEMPAVQGVASVLRTRLHNFGVDQQPKSPLDVFAARDAFLPGGSFAIKRGA